MKISTFSNIFALTAVLIVPMSVFAGAAQTDPYQEAFEKQAVEAAEHEEQLRQEEQEKEKDSKSLWPWLNTHEAPGDDGSDNDDVMSEGPLVPPETAKGTTVAMHSSAGSSPVEGWWWPLVALAGLFGLTWFGTSGMQEQEFTSATFGVSENLTYGPLTKDESSQMKSVTTATAGGVGAGAGSCLAGTLTPQDYYANNSAGYKETHQAEAIVFNCQGCGEEHAVDAHCKQCIEVAARAMGVPNQDVETVACEGCGHSFSPTCETCRQILG